MDDYNNCFTMNSGMNLSGFRVIHGGMVMNALALINVGMRIPKEGERETIVKPVFLELLALNEDGQVIFINDEAWMFQFLPIVGK